MFKKEKVSGIIGRRFMINGGIYVVRSNKAPKADLTDYTEFEAKLEDVRSFVQKQSYHFYNGQEDGRIVSTREEVAVTKVLSDVFPWVYGKAHNRSEGDFYIQTKNAMFPVNVKLIAGSNKGYNNVCGKISTTATLLYGVRTNNAKKLVSLMSGPFTTEPQQYGILAINKTTGETKACTLFNIEDLYSNPANGFQFSFDKMGKVDRTQAEGQAFLKHKFEEYLSKVAEPYLLLQAGK